MRQSEIAKAFDVSQPRVSRLLKRAGEIGVVRTTVTPPVGIHPDLEEQLEQAFSLRGAVVAHHDANDGDPTAGIGAAAAEYLSATLTGGDTVGISSWSATLIATVDRLAPFRTAVADDVVQLVGGMGDPRVQMQATRLIAQLAAATGAEPLPLATPGLLDMSDARESLLADRSVAEVLATWARLTVALIGIGAVEPSELASRSGNVFPDVDRAVLSAVGAVGDVCFRFFDADGAIVDTTFHDRVIGISPEQLLAVPRRVGVAGGPAKVAAIRGALLGGWINTLITDSETAAALLA